MNLKKTFALAAALVCSGCESKHSKILYQNSTIITWCTDKDDHYPYRGKIFFIQKIDTPPGDTALIEDIRATGSFLDKKAVFLNSKDDTVCIDRKTFVEGKNFSTKEEAQIQLEFEEDIYADLQKRLREKLKAPVYGI